MFIYTQQCESALEDGSMPRIEENGNSDTLQDGAQKSKLTQIIYFIFVNMLILRYKVYKYASILTVHGHSLSEKLKNFERQNVFF